MPNYGIIDSPGARPPADAPTSTCRVQCGLRVSRFASSLRVDAWLHAAGAMAKSINLCVAVVAAVGRMLV